MPKTISEYTIFVGTPSDVQDDVEIVRQVAQEINQSLDSFRFNVKHWSADAISSFGKGSAQDNIDRDLHEMPIYLFSCFMQNLGHHLNQE